MKRILLSLMLLSFVGATFAKKVEIQDAQNIALNAYFEKVNLYLRPVNLDELQISAFFNIQKNGESMLYIYNFENFGNIIISAEDAMNPVIGYSFESYYNPENISEGFDGWLKGRVGAVQYARDNNVEATEETAAQWAAYAEPSIPELKLGGKSIEPLLTQTWNQNYPYNYLCPLDAGGSGGRVYVGCVATAMSQIMFYWRYPNQGTGSHSYSNPPYGTLSANFGETTYDWNGMVDNTDNKINLPMALIGFHAGVAVEMDYGPDGSGAYSDDVPYAMRTYFGYDYTIQYMSKLTSTPWATWKGYIEDELDLLRPVYYSGRDAQTNGGGHAFVLDGYHDDEMYHFNFGWSGQDNGWYDITSASGYEWYYWQALVRKIFPNDDTYPYGCTPDYVMTSQVGSFEDGSGPQENYDPSANCSWLIDPQTATDSITKIQLNFLQLDTESDDIITVYDGATTAAPVLGTYSGTVLPAAVISTGNKMLIVFTADGDATNTAGFKLQYTSFQPTWCSGVTTFTATSGSLDDGSGSFYYRNQTNCMFAIDPPWGANLTLTFTEFNTQANTDILKIYDKSNNQLLATYSGDYTAGNMPDPIFVASGKILMMFQTDATVNNAGWTAEWAVGNTSVEDQAAGFDQLIIFPNPAENMLNISFNTAENQSVKVKLVSSTGTTVYTEDVNKFSGNYVNTIDLTGFAKGVYFLSLSGENGTVNKKVVVK